MKLHSTKENTQLLQHFKSYMESKKQTNQKIQQGRKK